MRTRYVQQHVEFKLAVLVYKALNDRSRQYLADDRQLTTTAGRTTPLRVRRQDLAQVSVIDHSLLLDRVSS